VSALAAMLPLIALLIWVILLFQLAEGWTWRGAFMYAALGWGVFTVLLSEGLSMAHAIGTSSLLVFWSLPTLLGLGWLLQRRREGLPFRFPPRLRLTREQAVYAVICAAFLAVTAIIAGFAPPNNWDVLNYHMARVAHWAQEGSIHHYATGIEVQNYMPPGNAIFLLQVYILGRGDQWVNFIQWFSLLGNVLVASEIVRRLGGSVRSQWLAALFVVTLPMGIMQATSATSDFFVAFWLAITAAMTLSFWQRPDEAWVLIPLGAAAGMAVLSKQTSLPFLLPFAVWTLAAFWRSSTRRRSIAYGLAGLVLLLSVNAGYALRNIQTYGNPAGPQSRVELHVNEPIGLRSFISNLLKNASLHAGTPSPYFNKGVALAVQVMHEWIGSDVNDPGLTAEGQFRIKGQVQHETVAGNFVHAVLMLAATAVFLVQRRRFAAKDRIYALAVLSGFLIFVLIFKWKITGSRYHLPFFVLAAPAVAGVMGGWRLRYAAASVAAMAIWSIPWLVGNQARPLISGVDSAFVDSVLTTPRQELYFANGGYLQTPYLEMASKIEESDCKAVGISIPGGSAEYPIWALLGAPDRNLQIEWIVSGTPSARYAEDSFEPCAVVCDACPESWETIRGLQLAYDRPPFRLYLDSP
jgi:hypothetical protein